MLDIAKSRRSVRKFTEEAVTEEDCAQLEAAALLAPSSRGIYPVELIRVTDSGLIRQLAACKNFGTSALNTATLAYLVIADAEKCDVWVEDASVAATYLMLEAEALGLGLCWIQVRLRVGEGGASEELIRQLVDIPEKFSVLCMLALGHKAEHPAPKDESMIDREKVRIAVPK